MSGLCGIINFDGAPVDPDVLHRMAETAAHRGPDGIRYWVNGNVGVAHLALNITPESLHEQQPLVSRQGDLVLSADARVDNRDELTPILTTKGFLTEADPTDADLIIAAYRCWGTECGAHLIGDFAFAIWDTVRQRLFAARDPMAMRAFYYRVEPRRLIFATEVKQILAVPDVPVQIFEPAVGAHLAGLFGPLDWTFYEGIAQLEPAHALLVDAEGQRTWRYWDIDPDVRIEYADEDQYAEHFLAIFKKAVKCRLRSLKPVGLLLSGGVDSGSIASTAGWLFQQNGQTPQPAFQAYCWAFEELAQCDERHISEGIVRHYGFPVTNVPAEAAWPLKGYPAHGPDRDEPLIGVYQALLEHVFESAQSEGMGVMLSGDRGDLMMGGWILSYLRLMRARRWRALWNEMQVHSRATGESLGSVAKIYLLIPLLESLRQKSKVEWLSWPKRRLQRMLHHPEPSSLFPEWIRPEFMRRIGLAEILEQSEPLPQVKGFGRRQRYQLVFAFMHMRGMTWSERSLARYGLSFADPWSDRRIASLVLAMPQQVLNRPEEVNKRLVRRAMRGIMPELARQAACKTSPKPLFMWALKERSRDIVWDLITDCEASERGYIDELALRNHYEAICRGEPDHPYFWWALTLEMWLRRYWS